MAAHCVALSFVHKRDLAQLRALDPMPVLGDAGVVSSILNCILKLRQNTKHT